MTKIHRIAHISIATIIGMSFGTQVFAQRFNTLEDAAVSQAKIWQAGGQAKPLMSSDGKVVFAFGQSMPKLTCSPGRACDIEMEPGERVKKVILADGVNWQWDAAESVERGKAIQHVVVQPKDKDLETNVIITTDRRTYHIKLYAPKVEGAYLNRIGFYYPDALVSSWEDRMRSEANALEKEADMNVMPSAVSPMDLAFDYRIEGDADFKPLRVFNDGERVYMTMPENLRTGEHPVFSLLDEKGKQMVVNYRRQEDKATGTIHYVIDKLFAKGELRRGSEMVSITWSRKQKQGFWSGFGSN